MKFLFIKLRASELGEQHEGNSLMVPRTTVGTMRTLETMETLGTMGTLGSYHFVFSL